MSTRRAHLCPKNRPGLLFVLLKKTETRLLLESFFWIFMAVWTFAITFARAFAFAAFCLSFLSLCGLTLEKGPPRGPVLNPSSIQLEDASDFDPGE